MSTAKLFIVLLGLKKQTAQMQMRIMKHLSKDNHKDKEEKLNLNNFNSNLGNADNKINK